jgi:hypothetical protein
MTEESEIHTEKNTAPTMGLQDSARVVKHKSSTKRQRLQKAQREDASSSSKGSPAQDPPLKVMKMEECTKPGPAPPEHGVDETRPYTEPVPACIDLPQLLHNQQKQILTLSVKHLLYYVFYLTNQREVPEVIPIDSIINTVGTENKVDYTMGILISCINDAVAAISTWELLRTPGSVSGLKKTLQCSLLTPLKDTHHFVEQATILSKLLSVPQMA